MKTASGMIARPLACSVAGCGRRLGKTGAARGLCVGHYTRQRRGKPVDGALIDKAVHFPRLAQAKVAEDTFEALVAGMISAGRPTLGSQIRHVLEEWAKAREGATHVG